MLIKKLYSETIGLDECRGIFSKYLKAREVSKNIDRGIYDVKSIKIRSGENSSISKKVIEDLHNKIIFTGDFILPEKKIFGTLKAKLSYAIPIDIRVAYTDLEKLCKDSHMDFQNHMTAILDTNILTDSWDISDSSKPWDSNPIRDSFIASSEKDVVTAKVYFVGVLSEPEQAKMLNLVDDLHMPIYLMKDPLKQVNFITHVNKFEHISCNMPFIVVHKSWEGFDEKKIMKFYKDIADFEKTEYIKVSNNIFHYSDPRLDVEIASRTNNKILYSNYMHSPERRDKFDILVRNYWEERRRA